MLPHSPLSRFLLAAAAFDAFSHGLYPEGIGGLQARFAHDVQVALAWNAAHRIGPNSITVCVNWTAGKK